MGQAAGTAAALSLKQEVAPRKIDATELQKKLVADGMNIGQSVRTIPGLQ
jgi:hypothetical protein